MPGTKRYFEADDANASSSSASPNKARRASKNRSDKADQGKRHDKSSQPKESFIAAGLKQYTEAAEQAAAAKKDSTQPDDANTPHTTLYLSHLPPTLTSPQLTLIFSSYAPIRAAFVVSSASDGDKPGRQDASSANTVPLGPGRDRTGKSVSRGFGYVRFVLRNDAEKCLEEWGSKNGLPADAVQDLKSTEGLENVEWDKLCGRDGVRMSWAKKKLKEGEKPEGASASWKPKKSAEDKQEPKEDARKPAFDRNAPRSVFVFGLPALSKPAAVSDDSKAPEDEGTRETKETEADQADAEEGLHDETEDKNMDWKKALRQKARKIGTIEDVKWPIRLPTREVAALIVMGSPRDAHEVMKRLNNHVFRGHVVSATVKSTWDLTQRLGQARGGGRLLVRNLAFDITIPDLRTVFARFGPLHSIILPFDEKTGKARGFAFIYFVAKTDAEKALQTINGTRIYAGMAQERIASEGGKEGKKKEIREKKKKAEDNKAGSNERGRLVAVDWALGKEEWEKAQQQEDAGPEAVANKDSDDSESDSEEDSDEDDESDEEEDSDLEPIAMGVEEDGDDDTKMEDEEDTEDDAEDDKSNTSKGTTLFVRNLSFEATEAEVYDLFKQFGPLRYARIVYDPTTKRSRGTAFVHFWNDEDALEVLRESESLNAGLFTGETSDKKAKAAAKSILTADPGTSQAAKLTLHGRVLAAVPAVSKDDADKLREDRDKKGGTKTDRRNLYLMREGVVFPSWPLAKELHPADMNARQMSFEARKSLLRSNPSLFISRTRLSMRQIPLYVTDGMLKRLANHAAKEFEREVKAGKRKALTREETQAFVADAGGAPAPATPQVNSRGIPESRIKQSKILRQADRVDPLTGLGRSKGYGFLEMATHADALRVLRWANANKEVGRLLRGWWRTELESMIQKAERGEGKLGKNVVTTDKDERLRRLKDKMTELQEEEKAAQDKDSKREAEGRSKSETSRSAKTLIIEFSIENAVTTKRRAEKVEKARERARRAKNADPQDANESADEAGDNDIEDKGSVKKSSKRRGSTDSKTGGKPSKKVRVEESGATSESSKAGNPIGSIIGRKRREKKQGKRK
ncbi:RNA recognition motif-containing protein [Microbotryomycetes sp. JL221]|nr:RNA recognition motif-containing protein [Microbotryomycetes sp. JL221]